MQWERTERRRSHILRRTRYYSTVESPLTRSICSHLFPLAWYYSWPSFYLTPQVQLFLSVIILVVVSKGGGRTRSILTEAIWVQKMKTIQFTQPKLLGLSSDSYRVNYNKNRVVVSTMRKISSACSITVESLFILWLYQVLGSKWN